MSRSLLIGVALAATVAAGCTGDLDKSGGQDRVTTVVLAGLEGSRSMQDPNVARFAELVKELSEGRLRVDAPTKWFGADEKSILDDVIAGKATLGWTGTRAFDLIGVDAFQPLHAPFLVSSYPAEKAVVADGVTEDMLDSLDDVGLTGLAVLADELRFPAAVESPLLGPADYEDLTFGVSDFSSRIQADALTALGAHVADQGQAMDQSWWVYLDNGRQGTMPFVTGNVVLWPRTTALVANPAALDALGDDDRAVIERAAAEAATWSVEHADDRVAGEMATACAQGTRIALASARQLQALRDKVEPVYAALRADPEEAALLARVEQLVRGAGEPEPIAVPDGCAYEPGDAGQAPHVLPAQLDGPGRPGELPAGTYRYVLTEEEINAAIPPDPDGWDVAGANAGVWTWKLGNGRWSVSVQLAAQELPEGFDDAPCEGYYDVHGDQVDFTTVTDYEHGECASPTWKAKWRETEDGLSMDVTTDGDDMDFLFGSKLWERID